MAERHCRTPASYFSQGGYTAYDRQGNPGSKKSNILGNITYLTSNYDCVAVVDFDHGVGNPWNFSGSQNEFHYMFEDNNGTRVGTYYDFDEAPENGIYDHEIYSNQTVKGKVFFAFINTCLSAHIGDSVGEYSPTTQGIIPGTNRARGLPFAWTNRTVKDTNTQGFTIALNMSSDGYNKPDEGSQCYIGFPYGSAALTQRIPYNGGSQYYYQWVDRFFDYALRYDMSVNMALDHASWQTWSLRFGDCQLWKGFTADWPQYSGTWQNQTQGDCTMAVYGNGNIKLRYYTPGWNDNSMTTRWIHLSGMN